MIETKERMLHGEGGTFKVLVEDLVVAGDIDSSVESF